MSWKAQVPFIDPDHVFSSDLCPDVGNSPHVLGEGDLVILEYLPTRVRESLQDRKEGVGLLRPIYILSTNLIFHRSLYNLPSARPSHILRVPQNKPGESPTLRTLKPVP